MNLKHLQQKYNLTDLEVYNQECSAHKVSFVANKLKQAESTYSKGCALRLIHNNQIGFVANYGLNNLEEMITSGLDISRFSPEVDFELPNKIENNTTSIQETKIENILSKLKEKGQNILERISCDARTSQSSLLVDVTFDITTISTNLKNSKDLEYFDLKNLYSFSVNLRETLENNFVEIFTAIVDNKIPEENTYLDELVMLYKLTKKHSKLKSGRYPILFTSKASKELFSIIESALDGKQVNQKSSPWHNKLGKKVLSKSITLKQEPAFGYMARSNDDEGNKVKTLTLVNNGILENFYFDLLTASKGKTNSTGNGFKSSLTSQTEPNLLNMIVSCGTKSLDQIIKSIDYGILVDQTIGGLTTNISGDMAVNIDLGFLIEKGELIGRVKDTMISGNIYNAFNNILELSNTPKWYWSNVYSPDILLDGFIVTVK